MLRIALKTIGCKLNQYETWQMTHLLGKAEIVPFTEVADIYIVNTCTVTSNSDIRSRQLIRQAKRRNPLSKIIVTGCYAQINPDALKTMDEVDIVLPNEDKQAIVKVLSRLLSIPLEVNENEDKGGRMTNQTRAFVKIQDGCDNSCSYCIVRIARGSQRSENPDIIMQKVARHCSQGCQEVVLTGIQLGGYGVELNPAISLADLLLELGKVRGLQRLRLSSIEPMDFTPHLLEVLCSSRHICPHFHIPLQSGDDDILRAMNRNYTVDEYRRIVMQLKEKLPHMGLGADVIVGFPGETESQFENTWRLVKELPFSYLHVFSFSPRQGTIAAQMNNQVKPETINQRSARLRDLAQQKKTSFQKSFAGQTLSVLIEKKKDIKMGLLTGLSENYLRIYFNGNEQDINRIAQVRVNESRDHKLIGQIING